jgi:hypothetical protein
VQANGSSRPRINAERAYLFYPSFGIVDLRRLTVFFKFASTSVSCSALSPQNGRRNRKQASTHLLGTYAWRAASPSAGIYSLLGAIAQRIGVHVSPRARPCLRVWSIQMDCSVCRSACGLTRRETNPASAEGWRASWSVARFVWNGRRLQAVLVDIRATACIPVSLTHVIVCSVRGAREM